MNLPNIYEKYVVAACNLYGMISVVKISEIYEVHNDELFKTDQVSVDVLRTHFISEIDGYYVIEALEDDYKEHLKVVKYKPYYIPDGEIFLKHFNDGYFEDNPYLSVFIEYIYTLTDSFVKRDNIIDSALMQFMLSSRIQYVLDDIIDILDLKFDTEEEGILMYEHLANLRNNSRMWSNNGYTPIELGDIKRTSSKVGRNDPCPCGSGKKYKKCCLIK